MSAVSVTMATLVRTFLRTLLAGLLPANDSLAKCWWDSARHSNSAALGVGEVRTFGDLKFRDQIKVKGSNFILLDL